MLHGRSNRIDLDALWPGTGAQTELAEIMPFDN